MISVPFIYFSFLSAILYWNNKRFDFATIISFLFAICGLFSILIDEFGLRSETTVDYIISPTSSFVYCILITINLLPFIIFSNNKIELGTIKKIDNEILLKILAYIAFFWFVLIVIFSLSAAYRVLTGDIAELRADIYQGLYSGQYMNMLPSYLRLPMVPLNYLFGCHWTLQFMAFFSLYIQKLPKKFFWLFLIPSLSGPWFSILGVDRSGTTYWVISFFFIFVFFKPFMNRIQRKGMIKVMSILVILILSYIAFVTDSRFNERGYNGVSGNVGGVINYLGQNYINFCYFFDTFDSPLKSLSIIFPFIYRNIFGDDMVGGVVMQQYLTFRTGITTGAFYTYLGQILICAGHVATIMFCFVYSLVSWRSIRFVRKRIYEPSMVYIYITLSSIIFLGLFVHFYSDFLRTFSVVAFFVIIKLLGSPSLTKGRKNS